MRRRFSPRWGWRISTAAPRFSGQPASDEVGLVDVVGDEDETGNLDCAFVVLAEEGGEDGLERLFADAGEREVVAAGHFLAADEEHLDDCFIAVEGDAKGVDFGFAGVGGELLFGDALDGGDLVAEDGGALEVELVGGVLHCAVELFDDDGALAVEEEHGLVDDFAVFVGGAVGGAGSDAAADVVLEAGSRVGAGDFLVAGAPGEEFFDEVERGADRFGGGVGAEVACAVVLDAAGDGDAWPGGVDIDLEVGIVLVVLEADVEEGLVALDEGGLEVQRVLFGAGGDDFEGVDFGGEFAGFAFERAR